ncbi:MAG: 4'-phosphopantetheinyl transferase superfamily protein [Myxococcota bacterium]
MMPLCQPAANMVDFIDTTHLRTFELPLLQHAPPSPPTRWPACSTTACLNIATIQPHATAQAQQHMILHPTERQQLATYRSNKRKSSYIIGRLCAKQALLQCTKQTTQLNRICITNGIFGQPLLLHPPTPHAIGVSIAHTHRIAAAVAFAQSHPMAIDIEPVDPNHAHTIWHRLTPHEQQLLQTAAQPNPIGCTLLWTAWESLAKGLQAGLYTTHTPYEVQQLELTNGIAQIHFRHFHHVAVVSALVNSKYALQNPLVTMNISNMPQSNNRPNHNKLPCWLSILVAKQCLNPRLLAVLQEIAQQPQWP